MDAKQWNNAKDIFAAALTCDLDKREAFLRHACGQDHSLRVEIESLLSAHGSADGLSTPGWLEPRGAGAAVDGRTIGPYRLISKLGEGGMGQVWLVEQTAPVRRQVALKLVRVGLYDDAVLRRFQAERQSLAMMDHPAIAKVFDAGATPDGQPFFVMEYVPGLPITDYCNQQKLKIPERLALFVAACEGVQHAHQKAIIHRDLKPANLLVVEVDGAPTPRIIDFGLAKAATPQADDQIVLTRVGSVVGTPGYISPEQADPGTHDVDTRTDVYALGAVLYELLTGTLPFEVKQTRPLDEVLRQLREEDPPRPSTRIAAASSTAAGERGTEPRPLARQLRGDLDSITMKALERDRERRYGSPAALAEDIKRYARNQPVLARPASRGYRWRKHVRRHRVGASAAAVIAILMSSLAITVENEGRLQEAERLDREALEIARRAPGADHPDALRPMNSLGNVLQRQARLAEAEHYHSEVLARRRRVLGSEHPFPATSTCDAEALAHQVLDLTRRVFGADDVRTADAAYELGTVLAVEGKHDEAISVLGDAVQHGLRREKLVAMQTDVDLKSLRRDPGFKAVVADGRRRATAASKPE